MTILKLTPNRSWGWTKLTIKAGNTITAILPNGFSKKKPLNGKVLLENAVFKASMRYVSSRGGTAAHIEFTDTDPNEPINYTLSGEDLGDWFTGLEAGKIQCQNGVFTGTFTWVKRGTGMFLKPII